MNPEVYKNFILANIPGSKVVSGGTHINCRCRECPDSSDPKSMHMYISIPKDDNDVSLYYCHKCNCKGVVDHNTLIDWGIYDKEIAVNLDITNRKAARTKKGQKYFNNIIYNIRNNITTEDDVSEYKRKYICDRLGLDLSFKDLRDLKIVLNLGDLLKVNGINQFSRDAHIVSELDKYFFGFISIDNGFLNMRKTVKDGVVYKSIDKKYINYQIFDKDNTSQRFYTIPTCVDLCTPDPIKLHIAEGPFDILSIYLNCRHKETGIYTCIAGNNYTNIINHFLNVYGLPNVEIHVYPDNDRYGTTNRIHYIMNSIDDIFTPVYIHRNTYHGEKDFGVSMDHITESIQRIR